MQKPFRPPLPPARMPADPGAMGYPGGPEGGAVINPFGKAGAAPRAGATYPAGPGKPAFGGPWAGPGMSPYGGGPAYPGAPAFDGKGTRPTWYGGATPYGGRPAYPGAPAFTGKGAGQAGYAGKPMGWALPAYRQPGAAPLPGMVGKPYGFTSGVFPTPQEMTGKPYGTPPTPEGMVGAPPAAFGAPDTIGELPTRLLGPTPLGGPSATPGPWWQEMEPEGPMGKQGAILLAPDPALLEELLGDPGLQALLMYLPAMLLEALAGLPGGEMGGTAAEGGEAPETPPA